MAITQRFQSPQAPTTQAVTQRFQGLSSAEPTNQSSQLGLALQDMLRRAQGLGTAGFAQQGFNAQEQQAQRQAYTAPGLIGASPEMQASTRGAEAGALNPTIQGAQRGAQTFSEQIGGLKEGIQGFQSILKEEEARQDRERDDARALVNQALTTFGSRGFDVLDKKYLTLAGYDSKTIGLAKDTLKERELAAKVPVKRDTSVAEFGDRKVLIDNQTGETIKDLGSATSGATDASATYTQEQATRTLNGIRGAITKANNGELVLGRRAAFEEQLNSTLQSDKYRNTVSTIQQIKSSVSLGELAAMREASKTGGALGNISDAEGTRLESAMGNLVLTQTPEQFISTLQQIADSINRWNSARSRLTTSAGTSSAGGKIVTAPDGIQVEIID